MVSKSQLLEFLKLMYKIRLFEERAKKLYKQNMLTENFLGALHTYIGQEAIAVGVCASLGKDDYVFSTHRCHGHFIAKGGNLKSILAELHGKKTGCCKGRGGSMHLFDSEIGFLGGNGIVGAGIPLALGTAYASWYRDLDRVTVCFFGDGAACQGTFHESLNMAALWKLPNVFICENNCYAVTTPVSDTVSVTDIAIRAKGYGLPGKVVDGNDVLAVYEEAAAAIAHARAGKGPMLIECKTYRIDPHCMAIPESRPPEEIKAWKNKDPILRLEEKLQHEGVASQTDFEVFKREILEELNEAEKFVQESPYPDVESFKRSIPE